VTRLISKQVLKIPSTLEDYDRQLKKITGRNLKELALEAAVGISAATGTVKGSQLNNSAAVLLDPAACRVAVIPITAGQGTIQGFPEAICAIASHLGFPSFITATSDVAGLAEAYHSGAAIALMADDHLYAAINLETRCVIGNDQATARGYTTALKLLAGSLAGKEVLLIGAGPLGLEAAKALLEEGARLIIYDLLKEKETALIKSLNGDLQQWVASGFSLQQALALTNLIFDASPGDSFIPVDLLNPDAFIAAPGLPLGLDGAAVQKFADRLIHDPLQIGTAVMLFQALQRGH
jgi:3-methylornithyl-N6-L-lysine dehydrogenase